MSKPGFEKIQHSENRMFGPRKLLLCGFSVEAGTKFKLLVEKLEMTDLPLIWLAKDQALETIASLVELPDGSGATRSSTLPRAIIIGGISENELHRLMTGYRQAAMKKALWAALTPTSISWSLNRLLAELNAERRAFTASGNAPSK